MADNSAPADMPAVTKTETGHDNTPSSIESTPDRDPEVVQDQTQPQKRKGGRKPVRLSPIQKQILPRWL